MKISNSKINKIIEKILIKTYDSHLSYEDKRNLIFKKIGITSENLSGKSKNRIERKIFKINRDIDHYYEISDSSSNSGLSRISSSSDSHSSSSSGVSKYQISSDNIIYPKKKMTIAEKKKFCRKHGLIYDRQLDKDGKSYCRKDRRGRKKKKKKEEVEKDNDEGGSEVESSIVKEESGKGSEVESSIVKEESGGESSIVKEESGGESSIVKEESGSESSIVKEESGGGSEVESGGESSIVKEESVCNIKEDGSDINCPLGKICDLDNKKCEKLEENMEIHNINGANVIGDELIVKKIKELIEERNEFNMNRENDYDIKKCFGLLVVESDSE